ncbi:MAG: NAD+ synthase [Campylobacterales bacterium]|nr:NAD+ synthase [Campylobacterales bacterium]
MKNLKYIRVGLGQINPKVGDIKSNTEKIIDYIQQGKKEKVTLLAFGELAVCGYPPEDLMYREEFIKENKEAIEKIAKECENITVILGYIEEGLYNSAVVISDKKIVGNYRKNALPNYGVFDEKRYFNKGSKYLLTNYEGFKVGISICEDLWENEESTKALSESGCSYIININASPFSRNKEKERLELLEKRAEENRVGIGYVNIVGGQDELVFDGKSLSILEDGKVHSQGRGFEEELLIYETSLAKNLNKTLENVNQVEITLDLLEEKTKTENKIEKNEDLENIYKALQLGLKDYIYKSGFKKVVLGLSGGIDSALVAVLAKEALGSDNVKCVLMTSPYTSKASVDDAEALAKNLEVESFHLSIANAMKAYDKSLEEVFKDQEVDITEENIQARIRGNFLMALSNKFGWMVIATGNKSEMSVGYSTLYGDMSGGIALIKDVPKTVVYDLCKWINRDKEIIPTNIITRPPSAELRDEQTDQDDLPCYEVIDKIIELYIEKDYGRERIIKEGIRSEDVEKVTRLIDINEYKRRQAPIGIKITEKSFGKERRMPIINGYRG